MVNSHLGSGQYSVDIEYDTRRIALEIARLQSRIDQITASLPDIEDANDLKFANLRIQSLTKKLEKLQAIPESETTTAWCADYTEDLSGTVATAEVAKEEEKGVIISPGYTDSAAWTGATHGQTQNPWGNTRAAAAFNFAALPGSQLHYPTYRIGTITAIDTSADTCDLTLDTTISRLGGHSINKYSSLSDVPIEYMNCNSVAFSVGDRVLIQFTGYSWDAPKVIGFESNPERCGTGACFIVGEIVSISGGYDETTQTLNIKDLNNDITPILTRPSDWIEWAVGDQVIAINNDNCKCTEQCGEDSENWYQTNQLLELTNTFREGVGLNPLVLNRRLTECAQWMADEMTANCLTGHDGPDGSTVQDRFVTFGYDNDYRETIWGGENAGIGDLETVFGLWLESAVHRPQLVNPNFTEMGYGVKTISGCSTIYDNYLDVTLVEGVDFNNGQLHHYHVFGAKDPVEWTVVPLQILSGDII